MPPKIIKSLILQTGAWIALLGLTLAVFFPGLHGSFLFDDSANLIENQAIQINELTPKALLSSLEGPTAGPLGRPLSILSFALNHYFSGLDPYAFKATNLAIHMANGLLIGWLSLLLLCRLAPGQLQGSARHWLPLWIAAAWLLHPINTVPVLLAVQRMTLLATLFLLLATIFHMKAQQQSAKSRGQILLFALAWLVFWPLAILSKETGLLLPLFILIIALFEPSGTDQQQAKHRLMGPLLLLSGIGIGMLAMLGTNWLANAYSMRSFSMLERLMTETRVLWFYVGQIMLPEPADFALYHDDIALSRSWIDPVSTLPAILAWIAVIAVIVRYKKQQPLLCFAAAWFLVGHSLESTFLPLEIAHEYRNYLPAFGLILGAGYACAVRLQTLRMDHPGLTMALAAGIPLMVLALFTWMRADQLGRPVAGPQVEASRHPDSARANYSAAVALIQSGHGDQGDPIGALSVRYYLEQSTVADPDFKLGHLGLIIWACASGRPVKPIWITSFSLRLSQSPYAPADLALPDRILKPLISMPECLSRSDALKLLTAAVHNPKTDPTLRSEFLEAAANYELLVSHDPRSARDLLTQAVRFTPGREALKKKLEALQQGAL